MFVLHLVCIRCLVENLINLFDGLCEIGGLMSEDTSKVSAKLLLGLIGGLFILSFNMTDD